MLATPGVEGRIEVEEQLADNTLDYVMRGLLKLVLAFRSSRASPWSLAPHHSRTHERDAAEQPSTTRFLLLHHRRTHMPLKLILCSRHPP
jgi:hypothetical protein